MRTKVIAQFEIDGFHSYPNPPKEVEFLKNHHRHTFIVKTEYSVEDLNREKEIFIEREKIRDILIEWYGYPCNFGHMSCEMIAKEILTDFQSDGMVSCEVWEEKTGGARVEI